MLASIIFVTGLAGHAFGSWKVHGEHTMWIRDFLARDFDHDDPGKFRLLTYGYDSALVANNSNAGISEFSKTFLRAIQNARRNPDVRIAPLKTDSCANPYRTTRKTTDQSCLWHTAWGVS